jgi:universal stress protein E
MTSSKRILAVVDPTAKVQPATERAAWLAEKMRASLELFVCDSIQFTVSEQRFFDIATLEAGREDLLRRQKGRLEEIAQPLRASGLDVSVETHWDHPLHEGILKHIAATKPDLVVKDTHYHSAIKRTILSNTDWQLIRKCPVPLIQFTTTTSLHAWIT